MTLHIDESVTELLNHILDVQISSLQNISSGNYRMDEEQMDIINEIQIAVKDIQREARVRISHYRDMYKEPLLLGITSDGELSILRHILFHIEEEYMDKLAISKLWDIFFYIERERNLQIKLITSQIKTKQNETKKTGITNHLARR